jgi:hypothetical protein
MPLLIIPALVLTPVLSALLIAGLTDGFHGLAGALRAMGR